MTAASIAHALNGRRVGSSWMAHCVAHDDQSPSMSIRQEDGRVLVHCHAGCLQADLIAALKVRGLWGQAQSPIPQKRIVATYNYTDEGGELLYQILRFEPKDFRQRFPDGRGGWTWKKHRRQVLYHLPE